MSGHEVFPHEELHPSTRDEFSLEQMEKGITFNENLGHYEVPLPYIEGRMAATEIFKECNSFDNAKARLMKEKHKFFKDPARKEGTFKQIRDTLAEGHAREVVERDLTGLPVWYMPIHVVTRPDKPGKFRICQDAASRVNGTYLNEHLCGGPDLLNSLISVIMRFRRHPVAVSADIKNFFHMIHVADEDVAALRFLFFKDETMKEIVSYESLVHTFGASSSPPVANFTLRYHAQRIREKYGDEVFWQIILSFYVDDYLSSFPSVEKAREMRQKITAALAEGGFCLTKWDSSHPEVLMDEDQTPQESAIETDSFDLVMDDLATSDDQPTFTGDIEAALRSKNLGSETKQFLKPDEATSTTTKVLGLGYNKDADELFVRVSDKAKEKVGCRRDLLRRVASIFDPIGLVAPFTLKGKLLLQKLNELNTDFDHPHPEELTERIKH